MRIGARHGLMGPVANVRPTCPEDDQSGRREQGTSP